MLSSGVLLRDVMRKNAKTGDGCFIAVLRDQTRGEIALRCQSNTGEWLTNDCHGCVAHPWSERSWRSDVKRPDMVGTEVGGSNPQSDVEATALHRAHFTRHVQFARFWPLLDLRNRSAPAPFRPVAGYGPSDTPSSTREVLPAG